MSNFGSNSSFRSRNNKEGWGSSKYEFGSDCAPAAAGSAPQTPEAASEARHRDSSGSNPISNLLGGLFSDGRSGSDFGGN